MEPVFKLPNGRQVRMEVRNGTNDWMVCFSVLTEDEYQFDKVKPLSGTAVDVGAHIGAGTVALLELNPDLHVVAIEPIPENLALLRANTAKYGDRVTIIEGGAGKGKQTVHYNYRGSEMAEMHRFIGNQHMPPGTPYDEVTVEGTTLSELVRQYGPISLLKIDCEGCENGFLDDPAVAQVTHIVGEIHNGPAVRAMTEADRPKASTNGTPTRRKDPGEKPANRRKRAPRKTNK